MSRRKQNQARISCPKCKKRTKMNLQECSHCRVDWKVYLNEGGAFSPTN